MDGLIHEGRVKNSGQFSTEQADLLTCTCISDFIILNPDKLQNEVVNYFKKFLFNACNDVANH